MGYITYFTLDFGWPKNNIELSAKPGELFPREIKKYSDLAEHIRESTHTFDDPWFLSSIIEEGNCEGKWYDWEKDMRKLSKIFPDILFELHGDGEESDDLWKAYFKNGKMQRCHAITVFEEFDERKLI
jgi:hypothetical protein